MYDFLRRAHNLSFMGSGHDFPNIGNVAYGAPFESVNSYHEPLGAALPAYDLGAKGAISELKRALRALASAEADPFKKDPTEVVTETTWTLVTDSDVWDAPAAEELLLAISRYRGFGWAVPEPYVQVGLPGSAPQPTVNGLELVAGAANERLGGSVKMTMYEEWRAKGCSALSPCFAPPSAVSRPDSSTVVVLTQNTGPRLVVPADAPAEYLPAVASAESVQLATWKAAQLAQTEAERAQMAAAMVSARKVRDNAVTAAIAAAPQPPPVTGGAPGQPKPPGTTSTGTILLVGAVIAGGIWWLYGRKAR